MSTRRRRAATVRLVPQLAAGVQVARSGPASVAFDAGARGHCRFDDLPPAVVSAALALRPGARRAPSRPAGLHAADASVRWWFVTDALRSRGWLEFAVWIGRTRLGTLEPLARDFVPRAISVRLPPPARRSARREVLSRFALVRRDGASAVLESPLAPARLRCSGRTAARLGAWLGGAMASGGGRHDRALPVARLALRAVLRSLGFLEPAAARESAAQQTWEFHDLLFHRASRAGRGPGAIGGTYRFEGHLPPWPARRPAHSAPLIRLRRPDLAAISHRDKRFSAVLEGRRSARGEGAGLLRLGQLAEFLFRSVRDTAVDRAGRYETLRRVTPSGGGTHALETYLVVHRCVGLRRGLYHYDAAAHGLRRLAAAPGAVRSLLDHAVTAWRRLYATPDVVLVMAARFPRVAWKYERMAYRTVLLDAGALMQTLYLVATAMGLSPCALGNGDPDLFARATGCSPLEETSVAEFALSGRRDRRPRGVREPGPRQRRV